MFFLLFWRVKCYQNYTQLNVSREIFGVIFSKILELVSFLKALERKKMTEFFKTAFNVSKLHSTCLGEVSVKKLRIFTKICFFRTLGEKPSAGFSNPHYTCTEKHSGKTTFWKKIMILTEFCAKKFSRECSACSSKLLFTCTDKHFGEGYCLKLLKFVIFSDSERNVFGPLSKISGWVVKTAFYWTNERVSGKLFFGIVIVF